MSCKRGICKDCAKEVKNAITCLNRCENDAFNLLSEFILIGNE